MAQTQVSVWLCVNPRRNLRGPVGVTPIRVIDWLGLVLSISTCYE